MTGLRISTTLTLPLDLVTEATAIVATRGAGKSSASAVVVEEAVAQNVQIVVFDRTGVYWGLQSSAKGDKAGLAIYVLGGPHGNVPLEPAAGRMIADLVVDSGHSFVLDLSDFSKGQATRFAADFLERLYDRKARSRSTLLLVIDEAHFYAPQTPRGGFKGDSARLMGTMEDVVGLGRSRGLGVVLTTQRTQSLNKAVLDLIETLLVMRMLSPRARAAVKEWLQEKHEDDERGVLASLDSLPTGTAWVWSPLRGILQKVAIRRIRTFDSYKTPEPGEVAVEPTVRKDLDLTALGEQIAATVERAKADDPAELRRVIGELQREIAGHTCPEPEPVEPVRIEVPVLAPEIVDQLEALLSPAVGLLGEAQETLLKHRMWAEEQIYADHRTHLPRTRETSPDPGPVGTRGRTPQRDDPPAGRQRRGAPVPRPTEVTGYDPPQLKAGARRILETLAAHHPMRVTKAQLGTLAKFKITGGTFGTYWSLLKRHGLVDEAGGDIGITTAGLDYVGHNVAQPMSTEQLLEQWRSALKAGARAMLDHLVDIYPGGTTREGLAEHVGMTMSGGTFGTYLGTLRRNGLIDVTNDLVRASDSLFLGGAR